GGGEEWGRGRRCEGDPRLVWVWAAEGHGHQTHTNRSRGSGAFDVEVLRRHQEPGQGSSADAARLLRALQAGGAAYQSAAHSEGLLAAYRDLGSALWAHAAGRTAGARYRSILGQAQGKDPGEPPSRGA